MPRTTIQTASVRTRIPNWSALPRSHAGVFTSALFRITIVIMGRELGGKEISEDQVDAWVAEAERGYDPEWLGTRLGRPTRAESPAKVVPVRLTEAELDAVMARAERDHLSRSEAIRRALAEWSVARSSVIPRANMASPTKT